MKLQTIITTYGNGYQENYTTAYGYSRPHRSKAADRARKAKSASKTRCYGKAVYSFFVTLTVKANSPLRYDGKALLSAGADFLNDWNVDYHIQLEAYGNRPENYNDPYFDAKSDRCKGFHLHALVSDFIDLSDWVNMYGGYVDNQYCEGIRTDIQSCTDYINKDIEGTKAKLPIGTRIYRNNTHKIASVSHVIVYDDTVITGLHHVHKAVSANVYDAIINAKNGMRKRVSSKTVKCSNSKGCRGWSSRILPFIVIVKEVAPGRHRHTAHAPPEEKARAPGKEKIGTGTQRTLTTS